MGYGGMVGRLETDHFASCVLHEYLDGHIYIKLVIYNIDDEKCRRLAIKEMVEYDVLTKLYNRVSFEKKINQIL